MTKHNHIDKSIRRKHWTTLINKYGNPFNTSQLFARSVEFSLLYDFYSDYCYFGKLIHGEDDVY